MSPANSQIKSGGVGSSTRPYSLSIVDRDDPRRKLIIALDDPAEYHVRSVNLSLLILKLLIHFSIGYLKAWLDILNVFSYNSFGDFMEEKGTPTALTLQMTAAESPTADY